MDIKCIFHKVVELIIGVTAIAVVLLAGCGWVSGGGNALSGVSGGGGGGITLSGVAAKGFIYGGNVNIYRKDDTHLNPYGRRGDLPIASGKTLTDGTFNVTLPAGTTGNVVIEIDSGSYVPETNTNPASFVTSTYPITAVINLANNKTGIAVTPFSTMVETMADAQVQSGVALANALTNAQSKVVTTFLMVSGVPAVQDPAYAIPAINAASAVGNNAGLVMQLGLGQLDQACVTLAGGANREAACALMVQLPASGVVGANIPPASGVVATAMAGGLQTYANTYLNAASGVLSAGDLAKLTTTISNTVRTNNQNALPTNLKSTPSQGLIAIDTLNNIGYVPIFELDAASGISGNAQFAVVDLTKGATSPIKQLISLTGSTRPIAASFDPISKKAYLEAASGTTVNIYVVDSTMPGYPIVQTIPMNGVTFSNQWGGIIANPLTKQVVVAGTSNMAMLDTSGASAVQMTNSLTSLPGTDSISLNFNTGVLFISNDGNRRLIDTTQTPSASGYVVNQINVGGDSGTGANQGTDDGIAVDTSTNTWFLSKEVGGDFAWAINFNGLTATTATAPPNLLISGGTGLNYGCCGEGPGGQAAVNVLTHQGVIADEFGSNVWVYQLPTATYTGIPNSTPGSSSSAYVIAHTVLPNYPITGGNPLKVVGDPNSLSVDPGGNYAYVLGTNSSSWTSGCTYPLYLVRIDLNQLPATPGGAWTPNIDVIPMKVNCP